MAARDIYDIHYFAKNTWDINTELILERVGKNVKEYLSDCATFIEKVKDSQFLQGLGELINEKKRARVKNHLRPMSFLC